MQLALCQIDVDDDPAANLERAREALTAAEGAELAILPEAAQVRFGPDITKHAEPLDGPYVGALRSSARDKRLAIIAGIFEPAGDGRVYNTLVAIDASGELVASYRKIHLFDAFGFRESEFIAPGDTPVVAALAGARVGLITCYDIRFPEHARALVDQGADLLVVPAAWSQGPLKEDHWTTLVRARAIENTTWVAAVGKAPDPPGKPHPIGVGRSILVDPMGVVHADLGSFPGTRVAEVDPSVTTRAREILPALKHRRRDVFSR